MSRKLIGSLVFAFGAIASLTLVAATGVSPVQTITCSAGDFINGLSASGEFTCDTPSGGSGTISGLTTNQIPKATSATSIGDSSISDDGTTVSTSEIVSTGGVAINAGSLTQTVPNNGSTATVLNKLAKFGTGYTATVATTSDLTNTIGICTANCSTTGNATIAIGGTASCVFDGATTAGHWVQPSSTTGGDCHDAGATVPSGVQVLGQVTSTNGSGGTYTIDMNPVGVMGGGGGSISYSAGTGLTLTGHSFSLTTPVTTANGGTGTTGVPQRLAIGWPAGVDPSLNVIGTIDQASTVQSIVGTVATAVGSSATVTVYKAGSGTACGSGTALHSGSFDANGTAVTNQTLTVTTSSLSAGDRLCLVTTGGSNWTSGSGVGGITVRITTP